MAKNGNDSTFNELVTEISNEERTRILKGMKQGQTVETSAVNNDYEQEKNQTAESSLKEQLKKQSLFLQIWYWIKATFSNTSVEDVFNKSLVNAIAREIEHTSPGIIDFRKKSLTLGFYDKFCQLKKAADFFAPYLSLYEENPGAMYTMLGMIIVPSVSSDIERESDPYQYALDKVVTAEMKSILVQKMDKILDGISTAKKSEMYAAVRGIEWLRQFVKIPFSRIISKFSTNQEGMCSSLFGLVKPDFSELTRVMSNYVPLTDDTVQALYLFFQRKSKISGFADGVEEGGEGGKEFANAAATQNSVIKMFVQTVPIYKLAKVVYENSQYIPEAYGGGEDWFQKYRAQWKLMFERRWNNWESDCKKEKLKIKLMSYFRMSKFPLFPYRPWEKIDGGPLFHYELTLGFIHSFFKNEFPTFNQALAQTSVEGDFALKENRVEFSETLNLLIKINDSLELLASQLSPGGEYGQQFTKWENTKTRTNTDTVILDGTMEEIDAAASDIINQFGKACRSMRNLMSGILSEKITAYYGPLVNLMRLGGRENKEFREKLGKAKFSIDHSYEILQEIEPLDLSIGE
ncbi:MAG: hypothetical protein IKI90_01895 [Treponema sp.]|nr:hypothetical protein [Treponema sp.]